ncbi:HAMP domain-containing protein [Nostoc sp. CHAB 5824]|nr:HAMP domain-containing protein [Nostoc sp. CHAB 5824]
MARSLKPRIFNRLWTRLWLLAAMATVITLIVGIAGYFAAMAIQDDRIKARMPANVRAEVDFLVASGQGDSVRFYELYDRYWTDRAYPGDYLLIALISFVSILASGAVAAVAARVISKPISEVGAAAAEVAAGNLSIRVSPDHATGEVADLIARFNEMADDIEIYERERRVLTAGIAHELRTPLTILKGRLHGQIDGVIATDIKESERLLRQIEQLSRIVEDLRTLAHADAGELPLDVRTIDAADLLTTIQADYAREAHNAGVALRPELEPTAVRADPVRLTQIVTNLVSNAIKHSADGDVITISLKRQGEMAVIEVMDEGPGFDCADGPRLFIPFWRADANKAAGRPGSGMGLALADQLTRLQGGTLTAHNRTDRSGARFVLKLPAAADAAAGKG